MSEWRTLEDQGGAIASRPMIRRGPAIGRKAMERAAIKAEPSPVVETCTVDTSATDMVRPETPPPIPSSSISASNTASPFVEFTASTMSPIGFVERGWPKTTVEMVLGSLPPGVIDKLAALAEGRSETTEDSVRTIVNVLLDENAPAVHGSLADALVFYFDTYCMG